MSAIRSHALGATITLRVQPRGSRTGIVGISDDQVRLRVASPPVDGAANIEIIAWLSKVLKVPKNDVRILSGERGRQKVVLVENASVEAVRTALTSL